MSVGGRKKPSFGSRKEVSPDRGASHSDATGSLVDEAVRYKNADPSSKDSTRNKDYTCDACKNVGDHIEAQGFCNNCKEYLCDTCLRSHSRSKLSKHHTLLGKDAMPRYCDPCHTMGDAANAVSYCPDCKEYLCNSCHRSHSRSKLSAHHKLVERSSSSLSSSIAEISTSKRDTSGTKKWKEEYSFVRDINIKADNDKHVCYITDIALISNTELILCDFDNSALKFVDIDQSKLKMVSRLSAKPRGIAVMSDKKIAVGTDQTVLIFSISGNPTVLQTLKREGDCVSLKFVNEKLYLSYSQTDFQYVKFQILQPTGEKVRTIGSSQAIINYCNRPRHIAVNPDESFIYVSDCNTDKVLCISADGSLKHIYRGELKTPCDIKISPFGSVYVCNTYQHIVYKMTPDLSKASLLLGPGEGMFYPQTMCFNTDKQHLYIGCGVARSEIAQTCTQYANCIKLFKWQ